MRKGSLNSVFGLPTILTVLIVLSVLGFASLSLVSANAENKALKHSLTLLEGSYEAETKALEYYYQVTNAYEIIYGYLPIGFNQNTAIQGFKAAHPEFTWSGNRFALTETVGAYTVTISAEIHQLHSQKNFTLISQTLSISNDQDYTQNGDPIWKGP